MKFSKKVFLVIFYCIDIPIMIISFISAKIVDANYSSRYSVLEKMRLFYHYVFIFLIGAFLFLLVTGVLLIIWMIKKIKRIIETDGLTRKLKILFIFYLTDIFLFIGSFILFMTDTSRYDIGDTVSEVRYYIYIILFEVSILLFIVVTIVLLINMMVKKIKNKKWK